MRLKRIICKALPVVSLVVSVISVLLPWVSERIVRPIAQPAIAPPRPTYIGGKFWSCQAVTELRWGAHNYSSTIMFHQYWFSHQLGLGWMLIFVFQMLMIATGALCIVRERVRGRQLPLIAAISTSAAAVPIGGYQFFRHWALGFDVLLVSIEIGFAFGALSSILWLVTLFIRMHYSK